MIVINRIKKNQKDSFTLIEVLIFVSIFSLFFVLAMTVTTQMLRNLKIQEHKTLATRYAEELLEWLRGEKEKDWDNFIKKTDNTGKTYCFNSTLSSNFPAEGDCFGYSLDSYFKREATLTLLNTVLPNTQVKINITVKWIESGGQEYSIPINTIFTIWE